MINEKNLGLSQDEINTMKNKMTEIKTRFHNKEDLYEYARLHNDSVVIIVNLKQVGFYAKLGCQFDFCDVSPFNDKLLVRYLKSRTQYPWKMWLLESKKNEENK